MVMLFLWKPHQMVQNPEARNLDRINNTSCSPMVPVQSCHIAECKKMAEKNKKLIKKLEAKQKKALQRKFLSPEYLMSLYQQSWQNDWNLAHSMSREYEIHSRSLEKNISKILQAEKWQPFFRALQKKPTKKATLWHEWQKAVLLDIRNIRPCQLPVPTTV